MHRFIVGRQANPKTLLNHQGNSMVYGFPPRLIHNKPSRAGVAWENGHLLFVLHISNKHKTNAPVYCCKVSQSPA